MHLLWKLKEGYNYLSTIQQFSLFQLYIPFHIYESQGASFDKVFE